MTRHALVVGAGIGGLTTAIGLRRAGWQVRVVERWPRVVGLGAGIALWPDARRVLSDLGLGGALAGAAVPFGAGAILRSDGTRLTPLPRRLGGASILSRPDLIELLVRAATGVRIDTGVRVGADERGLTIDGAPVTADLVVGADGLNSTVRRSVAGDRSGARFSGIVGWRGWAPHAAVVADDATFPYGERWGDGCLVGITRLSADRINWFAAVPGPAGRDVGTLADDLTALRERFASWADPVPRLLAAVAADPAAAAQVLRHPLCDLHPALPTYVASRTVLVGDAAHAMTPNLARGACEALLDAAALVEQVGDAAAEDVPAALRRYDERRRRTSQRVAARSHRVLRISTAPGVRGAVRNIAVRAAAPVLR